MAEQLHNTLPEEKHFDRDEYRDVEQSGPLDDWETGIEMEDDLTDPDDLPDVDEDDPDMADLTDSSGLL